MITIKRLSECTLEQAVEAWNKGFEGYYFDATTTVDQFTNRMVLEGLSPSLSILAFDGDKPVGLILNGVRMIDGKKVSWNGGTGVAKDYRRKGVGKQLMDATLAIYEEEGVQIATLEAIKQNEKAIKLYENKGYKIVDELVHLQHTGSLQMTTESPYKLMHGTPSDTVTMPFHNKFIPWQTQWQNARDGESLIAIDAAGTAVGYAIYKRRINDEGKLAAVVLLQCEADPNDANQETVKKELLKEVFAPLHEEVVRVAANFSVTNEVVNNLLKNVGFTVKAEQVYMVKSI